MTLGKLFFIILAAGAIGFCIYYFKPAMPNPTPGSDPFLAADAEYSQSNYEQAIEQYEAAIAVEPDHEKAAEAHYRIAKSYDEMRNRGSEALAAYRTYLEKFPDDSASRVQTAKKREAYFAASNR